MRMKMRMRMTIIIKRNRYKNLSEEEKKVSKEKVSKEKVSRIDSMQKRSIKK